MTIEPAYALGRGTVGLDVGGERFGPSKEPTPVTWEHEIAVADCLTAITAACRGRTDVTLVGAEPTAPLLKRLRTARTPRPFLVPDCTATLAYANGETATFYIEIVRADVRSGNNQLRNKMREYALLNHQQRFRAVYGHAYLRAVLFLTTSDVRAEHFRKLAATLSHGRRLFWFGAYQATGADGGAVSTLTADTMLTRRWRTADGAVVSFLESGRSDNARRLG